MRICVCVLEGEDAACVRIMALYYLSRGCRFNEALRGEKSSAIRMILPCSPYSATFRTIPCLGHELGLSTTSGFVPGPSAAFHLVPLGFACL